MCKTAAHARCPQNRAHHTKKVSASMADTFFVSVLFLFYSCFSPYRQPPLYVPSLPISFPYPPPAIQIMLLPGYLKISVAGQIVRKEPDSAFQGHEPGPLRKHLNLCFGKASRATLQKSSGIDFKERNGQGYLG